MGNARGLVVDADNVFWAATTAQALMITPKGGGESTAIPVPLGGPFRVVADDTTVYFTSSTGGYIATTPKTQHPSDAPLGPEGIRTLLSGQPEPWALVVASEGVYFSDNQAGTVKLVASDGSSVQTLVTGMSSGGELAVDADFLYYADSALGEVHAVDRATRVDTLLADGLEHPVAPVPRGDVLYFLELGTEAASYDDGRLLSMPRTGGPVVPLIEHLDFPTGLAADTAAVYVCTRGNATNSPHGRIVRLADDGEVSTLAVDQAEPFAIAVDGNAVYWTTDADNGLRAIKR
jgi:sugar lactone lactonase YvrE